ncbi:MAG: glycosyltransferase [Pseudomonadota bacterium]
MKKVAIVLGLLGTHGPSLIRLQLASEMLKRGYKVDVVLGSHPNELSRLIPDGCEVFVLESRRVKDFVQRLRSYLKKERPDGVLASSWPFSAGSIIAVRLHSRNVPIVVSEHADFRTNIEKSGEFTAKDVLLLKYFSKYIYNKADSVVGVSQGVVDGLVETTGVKRVKLKVINNPLRSFINLGKPEERELAQRDRFWTKDCIKLLAVGRLAPQKDYTTMIDAVSILKKLGKFKLIIVGNGSLKDELQESIQRMSLEDNVCLFGETKHVDAYYKKADLFVMSSSSEGLGNVIVEALSFGLPVVATDCLSGPSEILVQGKFGILTPVGDAKALAAGIQKAILEKTDKARQKQRAADFSIERATDQYLSALFPDFSASGRNVIS